MEKVFFVVGDHLESVNAELESGGRIKTICPIAESVSITGLGKSESHTDDITGNVYAYVVIEYPDR